MGERMLAVMKGAELPWQLLTVTVQVEAVATQESGETKANADAGGPMSGEIVTASKEGIDAQQKGSNENEEAEKKAGDSAYAIDQHWSQIHTGTFDADNNAALHDNDDWFRSKR